MREANSYLLTLVILASAFAAHADPRPVPKQQVQIAVWTDEARDDAKSVGALARHAQTQIPGLIVTVRSLPRSQARTELNRWTSSDSLGYPDVVIVPGRWLPCYAHGLQPLNALLSARDLRNYPDAVKECLRCSGTLYGVPWTGETQALFYRSDLFDAAGVLPPRTWDELVIAARRCHSPPEVYGFGLPGTRDDGGAQLLLQLLRASGADLPAIQNPRALDTIALEHALSRYADLHAVAESEVLAWDADSLEAFFVDGRLAMLLAPKSFEEYIRQNAPELEWRTAPVPGGRAVVGQIRVQVACILKTTRHRDAAVKLLKVLATRDSAALRLKLGGIPLETNLAKDYRLDPAYSAYLATISVARGIPVERWPATRPVLSDALFYVLTGRMSATEAAGMVRTRLIEGGAIRTPRTMNRPTG